MSSSSKLKISLPQQVATRLRDNIHKQKLIPGDKLPTEPVLMSELGVSRTVLREAIATLKAEGLVEAKQGIGVFISTPKTQTLASLSNLASTKTPLSDIIETLELRLAIEVEAVRLAILRATMAQEAEIYRCFDELVSRLKRYEDAEEEDFQFHLAIAKASNNKHFEDILSVVAQRTIPRTRLHDEAKLTKQADIEATLIREHQDIMDAIERKEIEAGQKAMRSHLMNGLTRYRGLIREIGRSKHQTLQQELSTQAEPEQGA